MLKKALVFLMLILISCSIVYAKGSRGGSAKYKFTRPYVTKSGKYRSGAIKDVSGNGNKYDNADALRLNN